ncbi:MAG TPA: hypothetical protein VK698_12025 [Kofleriaceae bacterium]|nr:hypothetical protein [Kofleriaceae bacterium]
MSARVSIPLALAFSIAAGATARAQVPDDKKKLVEEADRIAEKVSKLRGLAILKPIKRGVMSKPQITERLLKRVRSEYKPDEIVNEGMAMKRFGLLPPDSDYLKLVVDLLTEQIAGFYDPWEKQLYIADWITLGNDAIMAHEIDHALQDQHFQIGRWMMADKKNADSTLGRQSLIEGDGLALMLEFSSPTPVPWGQDGFVDSVVAMMSMGMATLGDTPLALKESLVFPYLSGVKFIAEIRKTHPWKAVDEVYKRPPLSSEHILHPSTYASYERPIEVRAAALPALKGMKQRYDNVMGELGASVLLRQHKVAEWTARIAAAGWGGDRIALYVPGGKLDPTAASAVGVLYSVWDSEVDAVEFFGALEDALPSLSGGAQASSKPLLIEFRAPSGAIASAERRGDAVVLVIGAPAASAAEVRAQVWKSWSVRRP